MILIRQELGGCLVSNEGFSSAPAATTLPHGKPLLPLRRQLTPRRPDHSRGDPATIGNPRSRESLRCNSVGAGGPARRSQRRPDAPVTAGRFRGDHTRTRGLAACGAPSLPASSPIRRRTKDLFVPVSSWVFTTKQASSAGNRRPTPFGTATTASPRVDANVQRRYHFYIQALGPQLATAPRRKSVPPGMPWLFRVFRF